jgi:hypothetical protein
MCRYWRQPSRLGACHDGQVLPDADRSLANWLRRLLPEGAGIRFEAPDPQWATRLPEPCFVDVFLHGIRQDNRGQESGWSDIRDAQGRVVGRRPAAQYYQLAYLATAWAGTGAAAERVAAEHELLGVMLSGCAHHGVMPDDCLEGTLADSGLKTVLECSPADSHTLAGTLWSGLGIAPRACLDLVLIAPTRPPVLADVAPPAREIVLNAAELSPPARPSAAGAAAPSAERSFGTLRRWEKQTVYEPR